MGMKFCSFAGRWGRKNRFCKHARAGRTYQATSVLLCQICGVSIVDSGAAAAIVPALVLAFVRPVWSSAPAIVPLLLLPRPRTPPSAFRADRSLIPSWHVCMQRLQVVRVIDGEAHSCRIVARAASAMKPRVLIKPRLFESTGLNSYSPASPRPSVGAGAGDLEAGDPDDDYGIWIELNSTGKRWHPWRKR